jgi:hypothetical protein
VSDEELFNAIDGLFAYDMGATDSGVYDPVLRARVKIELRADLPACERLTRFSQRLTSLPDVVEFLRWLSDSMDIDL